MTETMVELKLEEKKGT